MTEVFTAFSSNSTPTSPIENIVGNGDLSTGEGPQHEKDEIFWTELEIRRLGNLVAECIHARRYVGDSATAENERKQMRTYVEAMKRKSMRVLHRAELYLRSGHAAWPGIDSTIADPVSLAEEYVRVVENYEAVLSEEESRAREAKSKFGSISNENSALNDLKTEEDDWEAADSAAYREALERERTSAKNPSQERQELIGEAEGMRRRKSEAESSNVGPSNYSKEDEELMARHQPIQDELTSNLVNLVGQMKESISSNSDKLKKDSKVLAETEDAVDKNVAGIQKQRTDLNKFAQATSVSWWLMMGAALVIIVVFIFVLILLKVPL